MPFRYSLSRSRRSNPATPRAFGADIDAILRNVTRCRFRSLIDGVDAFEQIRVVPEHVNRTAFTTPDPDESCICSLPWRLHGCLSR